MLIVITIIIIIAVADNLVTRVVVLLRSMMSIVITIIAVADNLVTRVVLLLRSIIIDQSLLSTWATMLIVITIIAAIDNLRSSAFTTNFGGMIFNVSTSNGNQSVPVASYYRHGREAIVVGMILIII